MCHDQTAGESLLKSYLSALFYEHGESPAPDDVLDERRRLLQVHQHKVRVERQEHQVRSLGREFENATNIQS